MEEICAKCCEELGSLERVRTRKKVKKLERNKNHSVFVSDNLSFAGALSSNKHIPNRNRHEQ
jgi:hypothetical protein